MTEPSARSLDDRLKTVALVLGLMSTAIGVFVAVKTQLISTATGAIDSKVQQTQSQTAAIDEKLRQQDLQLKALDARNKTWDSSARVVAEWRVMNANEFALALERGTLRLAWLDPALQQQLTESAKVWKGHGHLMGRTADDGLLLRQVVCLRLMNIGTGPAAKVTLLAHLRDFNGADGGVDGGTLPKLKASLQDQTPQELNLGQLMEIAQETRNLTTQLLVPVAQVVGSQRYVGRVVMPLRLQWHDERQDKPGSLDIDVSDPQLADRLTSALLGRSTSR